MRLEVVTKTPTFRTGIVGAIAVTVWDGPPTLADAEAAVSLLETLAAREPRIMMFAILGPGAPTPSGEIRNPIATTVRLLGDRVTAGASVVEGAGFRAAAMRGVLVGMELLTRMSFTHKICSTVAEGAAFLAGYEPRVTAETLTAAVAELRA